ncbi:MAG TPA: AmmeMemoRadiSam system protein B [Candidatus Magasanikbacteria bacterium]|nr:AmmeMemoRadiSam system protein B [Candidatus Magasanikbacteria bacterium]
MKKNVLIISAVILALFVIALIIGAYVNRDISFSHSNSFPVIRTIAGEKIITETHFASPSAESDYAKYFSTDSQFEKFSVDVIGMVIPHHLVAGQIIADTLRAAEKADPKLIVLITPDHFALGRKQISYSLADWRTPFGLLSGADSSVAETMRSLKYVTNDEKVFETEHAVAGTVSFIEKIFPDARVLPITIKQGTDAGKIKYLANELNKLAPKQTLFVASVDSSHFQTENAANFHDEMTRNILENATTNGLTRVEVDSPESLRLLFEVLKLRGAQKLAGITHSNSNQVLHANANSVTSYFGSYYTSGIPEKTSQASILFFGDMMLGRNVEKVISASGTDSILAKLAGEENRFFSGMDRITANLEGPFADKYRPTSKSIAFRFDPARISILTKYNFSFVDLANNHMMDMGRDGFAENKANLAKAQIGYYGAQYSFGPESVYHDEINGLKFAFISFNDTDFKVDEIQLVKMIAEEKKNSDFVIMSPHWGEEYKYLSSNTRQRTLAKKMIDAGADMIVGHHPHVVQEMEYYNGKPIFYSLGNFVFDQYWSENTQKGLAVGAVFVEGESPKLYLFPLQSAGSKVAQMVKVFRDKFIAEFRKAGRASVVEWVNVVF